ncbi:MAG TPA: B12-binding domain-containing protein [Mycobacteriales bacterium]|nr:B12-binding domain-containing protein [Mycobacteriales bacterium]
MTGALGPAAFLGRRDPHGSGGGRPYPPCDGGTSSDVVVAAVRALLRTTTPHDVHAVITTAVRDLGGAVVPARLEPDALLPLDVSLGCGEPLLPVAERLSVAAMELERLLPRLVDDARAALARLPVRPASTGGARRAGEDERAVFLQLLSGGDRDAAVSTVRRLLTDGVGAWSVAEDVLAPAMREVGERWYDGRWSVADEHAATGVVEACAAVLPQPDTGPRVVFAAPEGEWHALPGRLAAAAADVRATVLGPGLPAAALQRCLETAPPDAVALSVTMATSLLPAVAAVRAAHAAGVPVVAGGRALGRDGARARALGADAWAPSAGALVGALQDLRPGAGAPEVPHEAVLADAVDAGVLRLALDRQAAVSPWVRGTSSRQERRSLEVLRWTTRHAAAAHAVGDAGVLAELLTWLDARLAARGVPDAVLPDGCRYLADALEPQVPDVAALVRASAEALR